MKKKVQQHVDSGSLWAILSFLVFALIVGFCGCALRAKTSCEPTIVDPQYTHQGQGWWCYQAEAEVFGQWNLDARQYIEPGICFRARASCEHKRATTDSIDNFLNKENKDYLVYTNCVWHNRAYCFSGTAENYGYVSHDNWCGVYKDECEVFRGIALGRGSYIGIEECRPFE